MEIDGTDLFHLDLVLGPLSFCYLCKVTGVGLFRGGYLWHRLDKEQVSSLLFFHEILLEYSKETHIGSRHGLLLIYLHDHRRMSKHMQLIKVLCILLHRYVLSLLKHHFFYFRLFAFHLVSDPVPGYCHALGLPYMGQTLPYEVRVAIDLVHVLHKVNMFLPGIAKTKDALLLVLIVTSKTVIEELKAHHSVGRAHAGVRHDHGYVAVHQLLHVLNAHSVLEIFKTRRIVLIKLIAELLTLNSSLVGF